MTGNPEKPTEATGMTDRSDAVFRAAGQVVAALEEGIPIRRASVDGVEFEGEDRPGRLSRTDALAQVAVGLAGVAAANRHRFGGPCGGNLCVVTWNFDEDELADMASAIDLVDEVDPSGDDDLLFNAWRVALDLVADPASWDTVEFFAAMIRRTAIDGIQITRLSADRPSAGDPYTRS